MNIAEYHKMHAMEQRYWWFQGRRATILGVLEEALGQYLPGVERPVLLDAGCGTGMLLDDLGRHGVATGVDFSPVALQYCRARGLTRLVRADAQRLPVPDASADVLVSLDVVEHVPDDVRLMGEFFRALRPGGIALMTVPAHPRLWSAHDVALHHHRRYTHAGFRALVEGAGFETVRYTHTVASVFWPAAAYRRLKSTIFRRPGPPRTDEFPLPNWINSALLRVMLAEARWVRRRDLPFGLSLLCVARKPVPEPESAGDAAAPSADQPSG